MSLDPPVAVYHLGDPNDISSVEIIDPPQDGKVGHMNLKRIEFAHYPESGARVDKRVTVLMASRAAEERATGWASLASASTYRAS
jgi:hypothetical protein